MFGKTVLSKSVSALVVTAATVAVYAAPAQAATGVSIALPSLSGRYSVGTTDLHLVDPHRKDPWRPAQQRELMVSVSYPAASASGGERAPWLSAGMAAAVDAVVSNPAYFDIPRGSVNWAESPRQARTNVAAARTRGGWPVVLMAPAISSIREFNAGLTDDLASHGYVVVSMSSTYESAAVEFPGGRMEYAEPNDGTAVPTKRAIDARISDARFVLDQIVRLQHGVGPDADGHPIPPNLAGSMDTSRVGMAGHSFGGYATGEAMFRDHRIAAGVNLDGAMTHAFPASAGLSENAANHGLNRQFLLIGADSFDTGTASPHTHLNTALDPSWGQFWSHQRAWKRDLHLNGAAHYGFTDFQVLIPQLGTLIAPTTRLAFIGRIDPARSLAAQHDYLAAFFDLHLKGCDRRLFQHDSTNHPDAHFVY